MGKTVDAMEARLFEIVCSLVVVLAFDSVGKKKYDVPSITFLRWNIFCPPFSACSCYNPLGSVQ